MPCRSDARCGHPAGSPRAGSGWACAVSLGRSLRASCGFTSRRLGVGPCRVARTLAAGIPALRLLDAGSFSASMPSLASNAGSTARAHPSRTRIPFTLTHRSPPARAGGTAGRWAIPVSGSPQNPSPPPRPNPRSPLSIVCTWTTGRRAVGPFWPLEIRNPPNPRSPPINSRPAWAGSRCSCGVAIASAGLPNRSRGPRAGRRGCGRRWSPP